MIRFWLLLFLTSVSALTYAQRAEETFADSVFVFQNFEAGGTTNQLSVYSRMVDTVRNVRKIILDNISLDTLNFLIKNCKPKKHHQQKIGRSYYASIVKDGQESRIALAPTWAILDLKNKKQYVFSNTPYTEIYNRFVENNYR